MQDLFHALNSPGGKDLIIVLVFLVVGATLVGIFALMQWRNIEQRRLEAALKQDMLQRGMSADEIVRVIEAGQIKREQIDSKTGCAL